MSLLSFERGSDGRTLLVRGEIDLATADDLIESAREMSEEGSAPRLDMRGVTFIDSTGIRALIVISRIADAELEIVSPSEPVRRVLGLIELDHSLPLRVVDELPEAGRR